MNYLAGFLLTLELLPLLRPSAPARIVNVASIGQHPIDFDDLMLERGYSGVRAYGQSKLAQIMSGFELAGRLPAAEVTVNSLHPATYMPTKMVLDEIGHSIDSLDDRCGGDAAAGQRPRPRRGHRPVLRPDPGGQGQRPGVRRTPPAPSSGTAACSSPGRPNLA